MHLAVAMLNGKTYSQCESTFNPSTSKPSASLIAKYIHPALPLEERKHAKALAEIWLKRGDMRLHAIRETGLD